MEADHAALGEAPLGVPELLGDGAAEDHVRTEGREGLGGARPRGRQEGLDARPLIDLLERGEPLVAALPYGDPACAERLLVDLRRAASGD